MLRVGGEGRPLDLWDCVIEGAAGPQPFLLPLPFDSSHGPATFAWPLTPHQGPIPHWLEPQLAFLSMAYLPLSSTFTVLWSPPLTDVPPRYKKPKFPLCLPSMVRYLLSDRKPKQSPLQKKDCGQCHPSLKCTLLTLP